MAEGGNTPGRFLNPRTILIWVLALALAAIFGVAGGWKLYAPAQAGIRMVEVGTPSAYGLPLAVVLGSLELFAALLLLLPSHRRIGAGLAAGMLVVFMAYMGARYSQLKGTECGCLPGRHRALGVGFFIEDGLMLAAAIAVVLLARPAAARARSFLRPALALLVILAMGGASATLERPLLARDSALSLRLMDRAGRVAEMSLSPRSYTLLYFYNPSCLDCMRASQTMARLRLAAPLIVLPDSKPEFGYDYLRQMGIKNALVALDYQPLAERFQVKQVPALYLLQGARAQTVILNFEPAQLEKTLRDRGLLN